MRTKILDGAERLLRTGKADFSMRDLAAEAGVSFATPFNRFGSKLAIMRALSARRIDAMIDRYGKEAPGGDVPSDLPTRVALAIDIAVDTMLAEPKVNRAVMGAIGSPPAGQDGAAVRVLDHSKKLWEKAVGAEASPTDPDLPWRLAFAFRGVLSFWTAGELADDALRPAAHAMAGALAPGGRPGAP
ncbi:MAG: TetR family transcriptional regulator [Erythrobacter sp.]|nr:TetR family transcriptional regulator [Erythrobacter sp.]|tara:strand:- start:112 stop:672 length:561 start_codon:yes stop_codon:yes gene_type:complete